MKKKNYKEALLWAIIIILVMFIISLDVIWLKTNPNPITKVEQEDSQQASEVTTQADVLLVLNGGELILDGGSYAGSVTVTISAYTYSWISNYTPYKRMGGDFLYWADEEGNRINEDLAFTSYSPHVLYAKWSDDSSSGGDSSSDTITIT